MPCVNTIVIDVDGTLIPNLVDFEKLRETIREELGVREELKPLGLSLSRLDIPSVLKEKAWRIIEEEEIRAASALDPVVVRGNIEGIKRLCLKGFRIVIATHRSWKSLAPVLSKLGIMEYITEAVTRDYSVDREQQLLYLKSKYGDIVFIGDTVYDEEAARKTGIRFYRVNAFTQLAEILEEIAGVCRSS